MLAKSILVLAVILFCSTRTYETEGEVLVLGDDDFPQVYTDHPYILIEFYAPWCGHCKHLAPIYAKAAEQLKEAGSPIKLAKIDADTHTKVAQSLAVAGYPTLFFFINGTKIDYTGGRETEDIVSWVNKKMLPAVGEISSQAEYDALSRFNDRVVSIVLFSNEEKHIAAIHNLAIADDYNKYFRAVGDFASAHPSGTVKMIRTFDEEASYSGSFVHIKKWINKQSRPAILPFDDRTIQSIFGENVKGVLFFNAGELDSDSLRKVVTEFAKGYEGDLIFAEANKSHELFDRLSEYIKIPVDQTRIVVIDAKNTKKNVQLGQITEETVKTFLESVASNQAPEFGLSDTVDGLPYVEPHEHHDHHHDHDHDHDHDHHHDHDHDHHDHDHDHRAHHTPTDEEL